MVPYIWHKSGLSFKIQKTKIDLDLVWIYIGMSYWLPQTQGF